MKSFNFLELEDVLSLYKESIERFGGSYGVKDRGLLESAIAQPQMKLFGKYVYVDVFHMAAAYCFHLINNHPFIDGNKRVGLLTALVFLENNGVHFEVDTETLYEFTMEVAQGRLSKEEIALFFKQISKIFK